jgi:drug/metabolite transporter (DMT)-like permease
MTDGLLKARLRTSDRDRLVGIGLMCIALAFFSLLDAAAKLGGKTLPTLQLVWARYAGNVLIVLIFINGWTRPGVMRSKRLPLQILRSMLLFFSTLLNFLALRWLQLAETASIIFSTPLVVALLAGPLLGEVMGIRRLGAVCVGFLGVLIITRPGLGAMHPAALFSVAGCFCYAGYSITTRMLASEDAPETTMVYSGLAGVVLLTPALPFFWEMPTSAVEWGAMGALGAFGAFGHYMLILAHQRAPANVLSPFIYTQIVWMTLLGWLMFGDMPDGWTLIGATVVIASGLYLLTQERRPSPAPPAE